MSRKIEKEMCICAAIRMPDGEIIRGHRHNNCFDVVRDRMNALQARLDDSPGSLERARETMRLELIASEMGFVTSRNRFVGRGEAMRIQRKSGLKSHYSRDGAWRGNQLFSEDLY